MGNKWEVYPWIKLRHDQPNEYGYELAYRGESLWRAVIAAIKVKRAGAGCVRIEWR